MAAPTKTTLVKNKRFTVDARYSIRKAIGSGAYGVVVSAKDTTTGKKIAIKKIQDAFHDLVDAKRILREVKLMAHMGHENVLGLYDLQPPRTREFNDIYIISELMDTDLHRVIHSKQKLSNEHIQYFLYQVLRGLKYIHSANVLHRDLKPSNIFVDSNCDLKIADFGLARAVEVEGEQGLTEYVVTRWYRAPEIMLACKEYTRAVDVWSVGCILGELLGRTVMFPGSDYMDQLRLIMQTMGSPAAEDYGFVTVTRAKEFMQKEAGKPAKPLATLFPKADPQALDLLRRMLEFNPAKRITVEEALAHPYLAQLHSEDDEPVCNRRFDFSFEDEELTKENLRRQIWSEIAKIHPEIEGGAAAAAGGGGGR